ncbi:TPA: hypothetical protein ACTXXA_002743 [Legionella anisa]
MKSLKLFKHNTKHSVRKNKSRHYSTKQFSADINSYIDRDLSTLGHAKQHIFNYNYTLKDIMQTLPEDKLFRGASLLEIINILKTEQFTHPRKTAHHNIIDFVIHNNSNAFTSLSDDKELVGVYAQTSRVMPSAGVIMVINPPPVQIIPEEMVAVYWELINRFKEKSISQISMEDNIPRSIRGVHEVVAKNREITMVAKKQDGSYIGLGIKDIHSVLVLSVAGSLLSRFVNSKEPIHQESFLNPGYVVRTFSLKVGFPESDHYLDEFERVNKRYVDLKFIPEGHRVLTLTEATDLAQQLDNYNDTHYTDRTLVLSSAPATIGINDLDKLKEYFSEILEQELKKKETNEEGPRVEEVTDEENQDDKIKPKNQ